MPLIGQETNALMNALTPAFSQEGTRGWRPSYHLSNYVD